MISLANSILYNVGFIVFIYNSIMGVKCCSDAVICNNLLISDMICSSFASMRRMCPMMCSTCSEING